MTELYSDDRGKVPKLDVDEEAQTIPYIPKTEILKAITQLPKNKAVGEDNIPAEFLQCLGEKGKKKYNKQNLSKWKNTSRLFEKYLYPFTKNS